MKVSSNIIRESFIKLMCVLIAIWLLLFLMTPLGPQLNVFFLKTQDFFADFFNVMIYISDKDPYFNPVNGVEQKVYFPIVYVFMSLFSGFADYADMTLLDAYSNHTACLSCLLFTLFSVLLFFHSLTRFVKVSSKTILIVCLSSVFLFTLERGNMVMIAAAMAFYFLAYKDSNDLRYKYFALIALCLSCVIKGYPAVLGLYLLQERRYKDIGFCVILTFILVFVPFLYFEHGFGNIAQFVSNLQLNAKAYDEALYPRFGLVIYNRIIMVLLHLEHSIFHSIGYMIAKYSILMMALISLFLFFKEESKWKQLMLLTMTIVWIPTNNAFYAGLYYIPVILLFLKENEGRKIDIMYMLLYCLLLNPIQFEVLNMPISWMISSISMLLCWMLLVFEFVIRKYPILKSSLLI